MSNKGIYTALSGAMAQSQRLDTIANNIANSNTTSFKKDGQTFREYLTVNEKAPDVIQVPRVPASVESFYDHQGGDRAYVDASGTYTNFEQGPLKLTQNSLDLALAGDGFFEVLSPSGVRLTRNGAFRLDAAGNLVNQNGYPVLRRDQGGESPQDRTIGLAGGRVTITHDGTIFSQGQPLSQLSVVKVDNNEALQKIGQSQYFLKPNYQAELLPSVAQVHQGSLEGSNVNVIQEMTDMISATRTFESTQKALKAFDEMNARLVNDVPKFR